MCIHLNRAAAIVIVLAVLTISGCGDSGTPAKAAPPAPIARDVDWKTASNEAWAERIQQEWTAAPFYAPEGFLKELGTERILACQRVDGTIRVKRTLYAVDHPMITAKRCQALELIVSGTYKLIYDASGRSTVHTFKDQSLLVLEMKLKPDAALATTVSKASGLVVTQDDLQEFESQAAKP